MKIVHLPARLDVTAAPDDALTVPFRVVTDPDTPVDISGWTLDAHNADLTVVDGPDGRFEVEYDTSTVGTRDWWIDREDPGARRLIAGLVRIRTETSSPTVVAEHTLILAASGEVTVEVGEAVDAVARAMAGDAEAAAVVTANTYTDDQIAALTVDGGVVE